MKQTFVLHAGGARRPDVAANLVRFIERLSIAKSWRVSIEPYTKTRSSYQNRYLWGVCYRALAEATGQEAGDWHEYMLGECFGWEEYELFGRKRLKPVRRSSKLSVVEFADYVTFIQSRAAEYGVWIPDPEPFAAQHREAA